MRKLRVDVFELEHLVIRHVGLGEQHVHMTRHAAGHRVNGVFDLDACLFQAIRHFAQRMLRLGHSHAVARDDDDLLGILHQEGRILGRTQLHRLLFAVARRTRGLPAEAAENDADKGAVHALTHDVRQDRTGGANQRTRDDQRRVAEGKADASGGPSRV